MKSFDVLGRGVYSVRETSRLTRIPPRRIRRWVLGYDFQRPDGVHHSNPAFRHDYPPIGESVWLSFADLVEIRFIDAFLKAGVSWHAIRIAAAEASRILKQDHPFSSRRFKTDGKTVLTEIAVGGDAQELLDLVKDQVALKKVLDPYLFRGLEFGPAQNVSRWWHEAGSRRIIIDPERSFGKPIVAKEGIPTRTLADAFAIEKSVDRVAAYFEVSKASVSAAVTFEQQLAA